MTINKKLAVILDRYMNEVPEVKDYCRRCLDTARWDGNVVSMVVDAAFMSIGLNYFQSVVPNVDIFRNAFVQTSKILSLDDLYRTEDSELQKIWKNRRSWSMAKEIALYLSTCKRDRIQTDKEIFIHWAHNTDLNKWREDPSKELNFKKWLIAGLTADAALHFLFVSFVDLRGDPVFPFDSDTDSNPDTDFFSPETRYKGPDTEIGQNSKLWKNTIRKN